jgi:type I restriction enzyme S subunit
VPKLADVAEINPRLDRSELHDLSEVISFVPMASVSDVLGVITSEEHRELGDVIKGFTTFQDRDVLVAKITPCFENGKIAHARIDKRLGFGSTEFHVVRPAKEKLDDRYLYHFLRQPVIREDGKLRMTGSGGQKRVPKTFIEELEIPLPPLPEQRRIAAILDKTNALRAKRREAIAKLDQLLLSVFLEMFGDPVTNPKGWDIVTLSALSSEKMANGIFRKKEGYSDTGLPVVWIEELFRGHELDLSKSRKLQPTEKDLRTYGLLPGDILFCRSSLNLDGIAYNNIYLGESDRALFECHLIRLRVNQSLVDPVFLNYLLRNEGVRGQIKQRAKTSTMTTIDQKGLNDVAVILPSRELQAKFRSILESVALRTALMESFMLTGDTLFKSLQHQVFSRNL